MHHYDYIIIGAGISGLYTAYKLLKENPHINLLILEKNSKKDIGGRIGNILFEKSYIVKGAGIGREKKDILLKKLLKDLNINYIKFISYHDYSNNIKNKCKVKQTFLKLKYFYKKYCKTPLMFNKFIKNKTFKQFALKILGKNEYNNFIICSGYTDYEKADIKDVLYYYGFDDNYDNFNAMSIDWNLLIKKLIFKIGHDKIINKCNINKLKLIDNSYYELTCETNKKYFTKNVILATTIESVKKLLPKYKIYNQIKTNNFLRLYAKFSKDSIPIINKYIQHYTIVDNYLQKIIPMNTNKGIYMIAYSDNKNALFLHKYINKILKIKNNNIDSIKTIKNKFLNNYFEKLFTKSLSINDDNCKIKIINLLEVYWNCGTHYYKPINNKFNNRIDFIKNIQHPAKNLYVVGEMVALDQGWVEGALTSVNNIFNKYLC